MPNAPKKTYRRKPKPLMSFTSTVEWKERGEDEPMMVGYVRVSTSEQETQRQVDELVRAGVHPFDIWGDKATGSTMDPKVRPGWHGCHRDLQAGDILVLHSLDRLSRDTLDLLSTIRDLSARGVKVKVLNMDLDTETPIGRFALTIFASFAQLERDMAMDRTLSGLARAKERGIVGGASKRFTDEMCWSAYDAAGTIPKAAKRLKCSEITIKRALARRPKETEGKADA